MQHTKSLGAKEILELIFEYITKLTSLRDYEQILPVLAQMGRDLTSADRCSVWVVSDDGKELWTKVAQGIDAVKIPINSGIVGNSVVSAKEIILDDAYNDPKFNRHIDEKTGYRTKSMMVIPMHDLDDQIIGAIQVINSKSESGVFDKRDLQRLTLASTYAAETLVSARLSEEIEDTQREVVFTMGAIGESRSKETGNHVKRVAEYSKILALAYGLGQEEAELLKQASPMHDIGKVAIPDSILNKPGRFDNTERAIMETHAELGYNMIKNSDRALLKAASIVAYEHHERWDGKGYPRGLSGEDIHIYGRITAIADVFDALGSDRVYKKAWRDEKIFELFKEERSKQFDPHLVDLFFENIDEILKVRDMFKDSYEYDAQNEKNNSNKIQILGAYGTKAPGFGTSAFYLNRQNVIDAGNLLRPLKEDSVDIENIWITHSHLDHISDIAYILDNYFSERTKTLKLLGLPQTLNTIKEHFLNDYVWPDFSKIRLVSSGKMVVEYEEIEFSKRYSIGNGEYIEAFETDHTVESCGYIYTKNSKSVLITADTLDMTNIYEIINLRDDISSVVFECSFPSSMESLAISSKHLTPKLLFESMKKLKRDDLTIYINHIKPAFLNEIVEEIEDFGANYNPIILKDEDFIKF
jgi:response regulator RpfG family c-di-GMP phosphodiesterase/ribonuclease BN (tRNA processing enzyme)